MELTAKILGISRRCPKHKVCRMYNTKADTCRYGPYQYCGKYRFLKEKAKHQTSYTEMQSLSARASSAISHSEQTIQI
jgi:hypothetical protein